MDRPTSPAAPLHDPAPGYAPPPEDDAAEAPRIVIMGIPLSRILIGLVVVGGFFYGLHACIDYSNRETDRARQEFIDGMRR